MENSQTKNVQEETSGIHYQQLIHFQNTQFRTGHFGTVFDTMRIYKKSIRANT